MNFDYYHDLCFEIFFDNNYKLDTHVFPFTWERKKWKKTECPDKKADLTKVPN